MCQIYAVHNFSFAKCFFFQSCLIPIHSAQFGLLVTSKPLTSQTLYVFRGPTHQLEYSSRSQMPTLNFQLENSEQTQTHTLTHTHALTRSHMLSHALTCSASHTHAHVHGHTLSHTITHILTHTHTLSHAYTRTRTLARAHSHVHSHSH